MKRLVFFLSFTLAVCLVKPAYAINIKNDLVEGKRLYKSFCLVCHGVSGNSSGQLAQKIGLTPPDLTGEAYSGKSVEQLVYIIGGYGGLDSMSMPFLWKNELSKSEISAVAKYIKFLKVTNLAYKGDARNGKEIYKSSCAACHGSKGKGDGTLAKIIGAPKVGFTNGLSIRYLVDKELISVIRDGKGEYMPGWGETLRHEEIVDVASYVRSLINHR